MPKTKPTTNDAADIPEPPAELTKLRELEHELRDLLRRREQTAGLLDQARQALEHAKRQRVGLGHVIGSNLLDEAREAQRKAEEQVRKLEEDLADMTNGERALKAAIVRQEPLARRAVMDWWRERKQALIERIRPLADELRPLLGDLYQAVEGETLSSLPVEQFNRTVLLPLLFDGRLDPPDGSVQSIPRTKYHLESTLVTYTERHTLRELAREDDTQPSDLPGTPDMLGRLDFNAASKRVARELGLNAVAARVVVSRALDDGRLKHIRYLGRVMIQEAELDELIEAVALERSA